MDRPANNSQAGRSKGRQAWLRASALGGLVLSLALASACAGDDNPQGIPPGGTSTGTGTLEPCADGDVRSCTFVVAEHNGIVTCAAGIQSCIGGVWEECALDENPLPEPRALDTDPTDCPDPMGECDPSCKAVAEDPDGGVPTDSAIVATYRNPEDKSIPGGFIGFGHNEPCSSNQDCQFDTKCVGPTSGTCVHHKCDTGEVLDLGCDDPPYISTEQSCVDAICTIDSSCCGLNPTPLGTCERHPCVEGDPLEDGCDSGDGNCVSDVCDVMPSCCQIPYEGTVCAHSPCDTGDGLVSGCDAGESNCVTAICNNHPECCEPSFAGGLAHDGCTMGVALDTGIDTCVDSVCAALPGCCSPVPFGAACEHDPCDTGKGLLRDCDNPAYDCVEAVCAVDADCCDGVGNPWDADCVALVDTVCSSMGLSCNSTWDQSCVDQVATSCAPLTCTPTWDATCAGEVESQCGENCTLGHWTAACVTQAETTCGLNCVTNPTWSQDCVDMVASVCGAECDGTSDGECTDYEVTETLPASTCAGVELTLGKPCDDAFTVCNRGNTTVGSGVVVYAYPANSSHFPKCDPPIHNGVCPITDAGAPFGSCTTSAEIPPGYCLDVTETDCARFCNTNAVLSGNVTLMVNPPVGTANGEVTECFCENNWSDYHSGDCTFIDIYNFSDTPYTDYFQADCPAGTYVQWGWLTWDTTTPDDSSIDFSVVTTDSVLGDSSPSYDDIATASAAAGTETCVIGDCAVDLYTILDLPYINYDTLELHMMLHPTSDLYDGPTVHSWEVTYSCVDAE